MLSRSIGLFVFLILSVYSVAGELREWVSSDGKKLEAEFISGTEKYVTLRRASDGRRFTIDLNKVSEEDRDWVKQKIEEIKGPGKKDPSGCLLYTSPSPRDQRGSGMPGSA